MSLINKLQEWLKIEFFRMHVMISIRLSIYFGISFLLKLGDDFQSLFAVNKIWPISKHFEIFDLPCTNSPLFHKFLLSNISMAANHPKEYRQSLSNFNGKLLHNVGPIC